MCLHKLLSNEIKKLLKIKLTQCVVLAGMSGLIHQLVAFTNVSLQKLIKLDKFGDLNSKYVIYLLLKGDFLLKSSQMRVILIQSWRQSPCKSQILKKKIQIQKS